MATVADSLAAPFTGPTSLELCRRHLDEVVLLTDRELVEAQALAFRDLKFALEPAGAAATAGLLGPLRERLAGKRVGVIACGSNIDLGTFHEQLGGLQEALGR
jgi:threonine dehydratase